MRFSRDAGDGSFWMDFGDFRRWFSLVYTCRMADDKWTKMTARSQWVDASAGGGPNFVSWRHNPQWLLRVPRPTRLTLSMTLPQPDGDAAPAQPFAIGACLFRGNDAPDGVRRKLVLVEGDVVFSSEPRFSRRFIQAHGAAFLPPPSATSPSHKNTTPDPRRTSTDSPLLHTHESPLTPMPHPRFRASESPHHPGRPCCYRLHLPPWVAASRRCRCRGQRCRTCSCPSHMNPASSRHSRWSSTPTTATRMGSPTSPWSLSNRRPTGALPLQPVSICLFVCAPPPRMPVTTVRTLRPAQEDWLRLRIVGRLWWGRSARQAT